MVKEKDAIERKIEMLKESRKEKKIHREKLYEREKKLNY